MERKIIGRREEKKLLKNRLASKEAEFIAVYGRRRVGKTYLIKSCIEEVGSNSIQVTGLKDGSLRSQLDIFKRAFEKTFQPVYNLASPANWMEAFDLLTKAMDHLFKTQPFVIFLDELILDDLVH